MNPATNAAAIAMIITQTQIETPASFFSSISITSFVAIQMPIERSGKPDFHVSVKNSTYMFRSSAKPHKLPSVEVPGRINYWGQVKAIY